MHFNIFAQITGLKKLIIIFLSSFFCLVSTAQVDSGKRSGAEIIIPPAKDISINPINETLTAKNRILPIKNDTVRKKKYIITKDSAFINDSLSHVLALQDSVRIDSLKRDSVKRASVQVKLVKKDTSTYRSFMTIPFLPFDKPLVFMINKERVPQSKDELFYLLTCLIFLVAFVKLVFPKYFQNLFLLSFQTSFRQRQTREQLLQDNLASLMMNVLFFISGGIYAGLIAQSIGYINISFWELILFCSLLLGIVYAVKFLFLRFSGWVFNVQSASNTYVFIVFMINKIVGILLIPFLLILAFSSPVIVQTAMILSLILVAILLLYRYLISMGTIRQDLKVNALHFFLYLCAVEILPLLIMYKVLFNYIGNNI